MECVSDWNQLEDSRTEYFAFFVLEGEFQDVSSAASLSPIPSEEAAKRAVLSE